MNEEVNYDSELIVHYLFPGDKNTRNQQYSAKNISVTMKFQLLNKNIELTVSKWLKMSLKCYVKS